MSTEEIIHKLTSSIHEGIYKQLNSQVNELDYALLWSQIWLESTRQVRNNAFMAVRNQLYLNNKELEFY